MDKNQFNNQYAQLCQRLGDATLKRDQYNDLILELKKQIEELNKLYIHLQQHNVKEYENEPTPKTSSEA